MSTMTKEDLKSLLDEFSKQNKANNDNLKASFAAFTDKVATSFNIFHDTHNTPQFETEFPTNKNETLDYLNAIDIFVDTNRIIDPTTKFVTIYKTIPQAYQAQFLTAYPDEQNQTVENLSDWILKSFPPPANRLGFISKLNKIILRRNESPLSCLKRMQDHFKRVDDAINKINKGRDEAKHLPKLYT